jgi:tetratricopeptide (TPR) repeat protein
VEDGSEREDVLHECLTGTPPFEGESLFEVLDRVKRGEVTPVTALRDDVPSWVAQIVARAMARDPARRYSDGAALATALRAGPKRGAPRRRMGLVLGAALLGGAALVAGAALHFTLRATSGGGGSTGEDADALCARGDAALAKGDGAAAFSAFDRAMVLAPSVRALLGRSSAHKLRGEMKLAIDDATAATGRDPRDPRVWIHRAELQPLADHRDRESDFGRALALAPHDARTRTKRAVERLALADEKGATEDATVATEFDSKASGAWVVLAQIAWTHGKHDEAKKNYNQALEADPKNAEAYARFGLILWSLHENDEALAKLDKAVALGYETARVYAARAGLRWEHKDYEGALDDSNRALALDRGEPFGYQNRSLARNSLADRARERGAPDAEVHALREGALADVNRYLASNEDNSSAHGNRAYIRRLLGDARGSLEDSLFVIAGHPDDWIAWSNRAGAHLALGQLDEAFAAAEQTIALMPGQGFGYAFRGLVRARRGDDERARADLEKALALPFYGPDRVTAEEALAHLR